MRSSLILLVAAMSMMSCASRLKYAPGLQVVPHTADRITHQGHVIHTQVNFPQLQMGMGAPSGDDSPELRKKMTEVSEAIQNWRADISHQTFPPVTIDSMDTRELLHNWADSFFDPCELEETVGAVGGTDITMPCAPPSETSKYWQDDKAMVLMNMYDVIAEAEFVVESTINTIPFRMHVASMMLEMVSLLPKDLTIPFLESGSSAVDASVLAMGLFSRGTLEDGRWGSLRKHFEELYGAQVSPLNGADPGPVDPTERYKKQFDVVFLLGLADAPGLPEQSARILLSKIVKYAEKEQRIVVVPKWAFLSRHCGRDLTEYYVRLGFEQVASQGDPLHYLIYAGTSSSAQDGWVEKQQTMVGVNLWAGNS